MVSFLVGLVAVIGVVAAAMGPADSSTGGFRPPPIPPDAVVFLGDSLVRQQPWARQFPGMRTSNQGIGGNRSFDVLGRLDGVIAARPRAVFVMIGSNDVRWGVPHATTVARIDRILVRLATGTPASRLHLTTTLPRRPWHAARLRRLNTALAGVAARHQVTWIDTYRHFHDGDGILRASMTTDGSHANDAGKQLLGRVLRPYVRAAAGR